MFGYIPYPRFANISVFVQTTRPPSGCILYWMNVVAIHAAYAKWWNLFWMKEMLEWISITRAVGNSFDVIKMVFRLFNSQIKQNKTTQARLCEDQARGDGTSGSQRKRFPLAMTCDKANNRLPFVLTYTLLHHRMTPEWMRLCLL